MSNSGEAKKAMLIPLQWRGFFEPEQIKSGSQRSERTRKGELIQAASP